MARFCCWKRVRKKVAHSTSADNFTALVPPCSDLLDIKVLSSTKCSSKKRNSACNGTSRSRTPSPRIDSKKGSLLRCHVSDSTAKLVEDSDNKSEDNSALLLLDSRPDTPDPLVSSTDRLDEDSVFVDGNWHSSKRTVSADLRGKAESTQGLNSTLTSAYESGGSSSEKFEDPTRLAERERADTLDNQEREEGVHSLASLNYSGGSISGKRLARQKSLGKDLDLDTFEDQGTSEAVPSPARQKSLGKDLELETFEDQGTSEPVPFYPLSLRSRSPAKQEEEEGRDQLSPLGVGTGKVSLTSVLKEIEIEDTRERMDKKRRRFLWRNDKVKARSLDTTLEAVPQGRDIDIPLSLDVPDGPVRAKGRVGAVSGEVICSRPRLRQKHRAKSDSYVLQPLGSGKALLVQAPQDQPCSIIEDLEQDPDQVFTKFMRGHKCYDLIPTSSKLVVFDTQLSVKKAFFALVYNSVRAAPLWDNAKQDFVGMLTISDFIQILEKYYKSPEQNMEEVEHHKIASWKDKLPSQKPFIYIEPEESLFSAIQRLLKWRVHRLPVVDAVTGNPLCILTHKRLLRFLYLYVHDLPRPTFMDKTVQELGVGTYDNIATASPEMLVIEALRTFVERRVSALPVVDGEGRVVDIYAKFDVISLAANKSYNNLDIPISQALQSRNTSFEGVLTGRADETLGVITQRLVEHEVHRLVMVDSEKRVVGIVSLSDLLKFLVLKNGEAERNVSESSSGVDFSTGDSPPGPGDDLDDSRRRPSPEQPLLGDHLSMEREELLLCGDATAMEVEPLPVSG